MGASHSDEKIVPIWDRPLGTAEHDLGDAIAEVGPRISLSEDEFDAWLTKRASAMPTFRRDDFRWLLEDCARDLLLRGARSLDRQFRSTDGVLTEEFFKFSWAVDASADQLNGLRREGDDGAFEAYRKGLEALGVLALGARRVALYKGSRS